jgi:hypothetical protein
MSETYQYTTEGVGKIMVSQDQTYIVLYFNYFIISKQKQR